MSPHPNAGCHPNGAKKYILICLRSAVAVPGFGDNTMLIASKKYAERNSTFYADRSNLESRNNCRNRLKDRILCR